MNAEEFADAAIALLRSEIGWQSAIARKLPGREGKPVNSRTVRRWLEDDRTPDWVDHWFLDQINHAPASPWPRDEWVVGSGITADGRTREYVIHLAPPRFVARVVICDDAGIPVQSEEPADVVSGSVYVSNPHPDGDALLCEIEWFDQPPAGQITVLLEAAAEALERA